MSNVAIAVSEKAFQKLFAGFRDAFTFSASDSGSFEGFTASYSVAFHLENGTAEFHDGNKVSIKELDIKWDQLLVSISLDIREICIPSWCAIPNPFGGCWVRIPRICVFSANPDITIQLDLSEIITTSEISVTASPEVKYRVDPARTSDMSNLEAEYDDIPNKWQIFLSLPILTPVDVDLFAVDDIVGDLLENALKTAIDNLLLGFPGFVKDLIWAMHGPVIDLIRNALDVPDDINERFNNLLAVDFGLFNLILTVVGDYFAAKNPIFWFEDPYPILEAGGRLIPVKIPIKEFSVQVDENEMVLKASTGA